MIMLMHDKMTSMSVLVALVCRFEFVYWKQGGFRSPTNLSKMLCEVFQMITYLCFAGLDCSQCRIAISISVRINLTVICRRLRC